MKVDIYQVYRSLGEDYDAAIECLWADEGWEDEVEFALFLKKWTEYVNSSARFAERNGIEI